MRLRTLLLLLAAILLLSTVPERLQGTTPTEAQALRTAAHLAPVYTLPPAKLVAAQALFRARTLLYFAGAIWSILALILLLETHILARIQRTVERLTRHRPLQCALFVLLFLLATSLLNAPLRIYGHHVALAFGLSVQGWLSWLADWGKSFLLSWLVATVLVLILFWIVRRSPTCWWLWFWIPTMAAVLFGVYLSPILVDPLFDRFEPLAQSHPALVRQLEQVSARSGVDIPPSRMFLMRASRKVTGLNAYVTGFGPSKRLVLWDTTVAQSTPDELSGIFGHELGHYVLHHIVQGVLFAAVSLLIAFYIGQQLTQALLRRFGPHWHIASQNDWAALAVLMLVLNTLSFFSAPVSNAFSRSIEHAADVYGLEVIHGIVTDPAQSTVSSFQRLGEASLDDPTPHPFINFWTSTHPSIASRAAFASVYNPWAQGQHPRYFQPWFTHKR